MSQTHSGTAASTPSMLTPLAIAQPLLHKPSPEPTELVPVDCSEPIHWQHTKQGLADALINRGAAAKQNEADGHMPSRMPALSSTTQHLVQPGVLHRLSSRHRPNHKAIVYARQHVPADNAATDTHITGLSSSAATNRPLKRQISLRSSAECTQQACQLGQGKHQCLQRQQVAHDMSGMLGCSRRQELLTPPAGRAAGSNGPPCHAVKLGEPRQHAAICYPAQASSSSCTGAARSRT